MRCQRLKPNNAIRPRINGKLRNCLTHLIQCVFVGTSREVTALYLTINIREQKGAKAVFEAVCIQTRRQTPADPVCVEVICHGLLLLSLYSAQPTNEVSNHAGNFLRCEISVVNTLRVVSALSDESKF